MLSLGLLAQLTVTWAATCGTVVPLTATTTRYTAPVSPPSSCAVVASAGGKADTAPVRFLASDVIGTFAVGMSQWPASEYCGQAGMTGAMQPLEPSAVLDRIRLAASCGVKLVIVVPRHNLTVTGKQGDLFSVDSAKAVTDRYAAALPPDTIARYSRSIVGLNLGDDYGDKNAWGGQAITNSQIAVWAAYARGKLPGMPLGVRVPPTWVGSTLAPLLDYAWAQYLANKGDPQAWFDGMASDAKAKGLRLVTGVNLQNCYGPSTPACSPADLTAFGTVAVTHPASCAFISWTYDPTWWSQPDVRLAFAGLLVLGRQRAPAECRR